ncbi:E3 ubiquitin-protein ligase TRIM71-like [Orbicella faveolata]|uniref:E3 ubiquitin-protein ligase TRIM71-like n=1 Tax=Orbicella faveolata TaxID=48498 RepID=UPI0009E36368|nr:E3 ubiquitin-protein ligase TRIM71-like [Orbicella faveolata]
MEKCKGLLNAKKMNIYKPSYVQYKTNEEDIQSRQKLEEKQALQSRQRIQRGGSEIDQIVVKVRTPSEQDLDINTADNEDGKYYVTYTPECDGHHDVVIEVNGQPLTSSPWSVHVKPHQYHAVRSFGSGGKVQGQFDCPFGIAISDKTGNIAVADTFNNRVQLFNSNGIYLREYGRKGLDAKKLHCPFSVAFNKSGEVTICDSGGIFCLAESGHFIKNIFNKHLINPVSITIACDDRMLVSDSGDNKVKVLSPDGTKLLQSLSVPGFDECPWFALHHQDRFFVSYDKAQCVKIFDNEGEFLYDFGTEEPGKLCESFKLAVDKFNNLLVCDAENCKAFTLGGKFLNSIIGQPALNRNIFSVAVSNGGQVLITDIAKHCVHVFE